jgi:hypothetical protein
VLVAEHAEEYSIKINVPLPTIQQRNAIMPWLRVTRVSSDNPTEHDAVLLNTAHIISIEHVRETVYVYLRDGRHFAVADSLEMLNAALIPSAT